MTADLGQASLGSELDGSYTVVVSMNALEHAAAREVRGLTLLQPWATLMALGEKRVETRSWRTRYRGLIAITASARWRPAEKAVVQSEPFAPVLARNGFATEALPLGMVVCVGWLQDCVPCESFDFRMHEVGEHEAAFGDYGRGRFAWVFAGMRAVTQPVPITGALGLFALPPHAEEALFGVAEAVAAHR